MQKTPSFLNFSDVCPEPVLVKQGRFQYKLAQKSRFPHRDLEVERFVAEWAFVSFHQIDQAAPDSSPL
jgi:hypothetical protein